jgi:flavin reductase (DIM6/NTAB) family NADH-FMN oxidoreductase RutF
MKEDIGLEKTSWMLSPRPTVLVTCMGKEGEPNIITLSWAMPTSLRPPMVAISVGAGRYSHDLIKESGEFVINIPTKDIESDTWICGTTSGRNVDKFKETNLTTEKSKKVNAPSIKECPINIECKVKESIKSGDHTIYIGEVVALRADPEIHKDGIPDPVAGKILYWRNARKKDDTFYFTK